MTPFESPLRFGCALLPPSLDSVLRGLLMIDDPQDGHPSVGLTNEALPTVMRRRRSPLLLGARNSTDDPRARRRLDRRPDLSGRRYCKKDRAKHARRSGFSIANAMPAFDPDRCLFATGARRSWSGAQATDTDARNIHLRAKIIHLSTRFGVEPRSRPDRGRVRHGGLWPCAIWKPPDRIAIQQQRSR